MSRATYLFYYAVIMKLKGSKFGRPYIKNDIPKIKPIKNII